MSGWPTTLPQVNVSVPMQLSATDFRTPAARDSNRRPEQQCPDKTLMLRSSQGTLVAKCVIEQRGLPR